MSYIVTLYIKRDGMGGWSMVDDERTGEGIEHFELRNLNSVVLGLPTTRI